MNMREFALKMVKRGTALADNVAQYRTDMGTAILQELVTATPVDTSLHKSRWQIGLDQRPNFVDDFAVGKFGSTSAITGRLTVGRGRLNLRNTGKTKIIFISNNGPAIRLLNEGYSKQAPSGFIQASLARGFNLARTRRKSFVR